MAKHLCVGHGFTGGWKSHRRSTQSIFAKRACDTAKMKFLTAGIAEHPEQSSQRNFAQRSLYKARAGSHLSGKCSSRQIGTFCDIWKSFRDIGKAFQDIGKRLCDLGKGFRDLGETFRDIGKGFPDLGKRLCDIAKRFCDLTKPFRDIGKRFRDLRKTFCDLGKRLCDIAKPFRDIRKRLCDLTKRLRDLGKSLRNRSTKRQRFRLALTAVSYQWPLLWLDRAAIRSASK